MNVRPYVLTDRDACLAAFDSNVPNYFQAQERRDFEAFLDDTNCHYFVMEQDSAIAGCGGYFLTENKALARLVWGMVHRDWQRQGLGRFLLLYRLREITKTGGVEMVRLDTSEHSAPFFESQGFKVMRIVKDGYAPGSDRVEMTMKLTVCSK